MKKIFIVLMIAGLGFVAVYGDSLPHTFKSGGVNSADMLNENFTHLKNNQKLINFNELIGQWNLTAYIGYETYSTYAIRSIWRASEKNLFGYHITAVSFSELDDGDKFLTSQRPNPFKCDEGTPINTVLEIDNNTLFFYINRQNRTVSYNLKKINKDTIVGIMNSLITPGTNTYTPKFIIKRDIILPDIPKNLTATIEDLTVNLNWESSGIGIKIYRRDTLKGDFIQINSSETNVTEYKDVLEKLGTYWYRIKSFDENGLSIGSNLIKIEAK